MPKWRHHLRLFISQNYLSSLITLNLVSLNVAYIQCLFSVALRNTLINKNYILFY